MDILTSSLATKQYASPVELQRKSSVNFLAPSKSSTEKAEKAAHDFEALFLYQMLDLTDPGTVDGFDGGKGEEMFRQIRNEHVAEEMAKAGGVGIADTIYDQLLKIQENNQ